MSEEKNVDESWKETVSKEKSESIGQNKDDQTQPTAFEQKEGEQEIYEVNFINYITSLAYQAMVFLGELPNPVDNATIKNLPQAKLLIDTLLMLREKTTNNLNDQEANALNQLLYELQMKYVEVGNSKEPA